MCQANNLNMLSDEECSYLSDTLDKLSEIEKKAERQDETPISDAAALASEEIESILNSSD